MIALCPPCFIPKLTCTAANFASLSAKIDTLSGNLATLCEGLRIDLASHQRTPLGSMPPVSVVPETRIMVARWRDVMQDGTYAINKNPLLRDIANLADYAHYKSSYLKLLSVRHSRITMQGILLMSRPAPTLRARRLISQR